MNIGLSDESVQGLAEQRQRSPATPTATCSRCSARPARCRRRALRHSIEAAKRPGRGDDLDLDAADLRDPRRDVQGHSQDAADRDFPQGPRERSTWPSRPSSTPRTRPARSSTAAGASPPTWVPAVNVVAMVFGNLGHGLGTGVAFTRDPGPRAQGVFDATLQNAQGEGRGSRDPGTPSRCRTWRASTGPPTTGSCRSCGPGEPLPRPVRHRVHRRTRQAVDAAEPGRQALAAAAFRIAMQFVDQGLIDEDESLHRVSGEELARLMSPGSTPAARSPIAAGSARRRARRSVRPSRLARAVELAAQGKKVILVRPETTSGRPARHDRRPGHLDQPRRQDQPRGRGRPRHGRGLCLRCRRAHRGHRGRTVHRPRRHHGPRGRRDLDRRRRRCCLLGEIPVVSSEVVRYFEGELHPHAAEADDLIRAVHSIMVHADHERRLGVHANADNGPDCARARRSAPQASAGPYRAHVPRRAPPADRGPGPGRHRTRTASARSTPSSRCQRGRLRRDPGRHGRPTR